MVVYRISDFNMTFYSSYELKRLIIKMWEAAV